MCAIVWVRRNAHDRARAGVCRRVFARLGSVPTDTVWCPWALPHGELRDAVRRAEFAEGGASLY